MMRTRWLRWLGQKTRIDNPYWTILLNCNWWDWASNVHEKNGIYIKVNDRTRVLTKMYFTVAIELADYQDLIKLDNLYAEELA